MPATDVTVRRARSWEAHGVQIGFHASHEQLAPSALLAAVRHAEQAGFDAAMCSDHFSPWSARQGESGYAWSWLGAALEATSTTLGVVTAPGQRYHPAIVAQAIATLGEMYPGRFWAALGSGEASNEHVTGDRWPSKPERDARLLECAGDPCSPSGDEVSMRGYVVVDRAQLWIVPPEPPLLFGAAVSAATAATVGSWVDGLITVDQPSRCSQVIEAFGRCGGGDKPVAVQVHVSWAPTEVEAEAIAPTSGAKRPPTGWPGTSNSCRSSTLWPYTLARRGAASQERPIAGTPKTPLVRRWVVSPG
ncbi:MAG: LLM class flavin-dependent oxidoreductase [Ilumatobacteraceae bacterium]